MNHKKIEKAIGMYLEAIGEDVDRDGLSDTPKRIAKMSGEIFGGLGLDPSEHFERTFAVPNNEMVVEKDINFYSVCEHHLLPFFGHVHVAYVPDGRVLGLSKIARVVEVFARRPQIQEKLTAEIAGAFMEKLKPLGVIVAIEAEHLCMSMRGVKKPGTKTFTFLSKGVFEKDQALRDRFFRIIGK